MKKTFTIITILLMLIANSVQCQVWLTQNTGLATGNGFNSVSVVDEYTAWGLLTFNSIIGHTIDGGTTWELDSTPSNCQPTFFQALSKDTAWLATSSISDSAQLWKTTDGGQTWTMNARVGLHCDFFHFFNSNEAVVFGDPDSSGWHAFTTSDGGTSWNPVSVPAPLTGEAAMDLHNYVFDDHVWTTSTSGRIFYSADKGQTWNVSTIDSALFPDIFRVAFYSLQEGVAIRYNASLDTVSAIYRSHDGGITWSMIPHTGLTYQSFWGGFKIIPNSNVVIANGSGNNQYGSSYSLDSGATWTIIDTTKKYGGLDCKGWNSLWAAQVVDSPGVGGVAKWDGIVLNISDNSAMANLSLYPNPAKDNLIVRSLSIIDEIKITDLLGKQLIKLRCGKTERQVEINNLPVGIYIVQIKSSNKITSQKFVKF